VGEGDLKAFVKAEALAVGFDLVGVAPPGGWATGETLPAWIAAGHAGEMTWLARDPEARSDPRRRFPWARSAVVVGLRYRTDDSTAPAERRAVSRYAWGDDYHELMARRLAELRTRIERRAGPLEGRWYVDTGPVLERASAAAAGLGWIAKNTMLTNERKGSFLFLGALLLGLALEPDRPAPGRCGTCARCLDACPTRAFPAPYLLDARRCISYLTIELKGSIPHELRPLIGELVFGCDICQEVCPWTEKAARREPTSGIAEFRARERLAAPSVMDLLALLALDDEGFRGRFRGSPVKRVKRRGLARNVCVALGNRGDAEAAPGLARALESDPEPLVRGHAAWALGRLAAQAAAARPLAREALTRASADLDPFVRGEALLALEALGASER
jgi:epoxyqueuosine reductase